MSSLVLEIYHLALWYFPVLMVLSGIAMMIYDSRILHTVVSRFWARIRHRESCDHRQIELGPMADVGASTPTAQGSAVRIDREGNKLASRADTVPRAESPIEPTELSRTPSSRETTQQVGVPYSIRTGLLAFAFFVVSFIVIMVTRGVITSLPSLYRFFANIFLAGTVFLFHC